MKTLFILGNGFDLKCNLKTKYSDYFNWMKDNDEGFNNIYFNIDEYKQNYKQNKAKDDEKIRSIGFSDWDSIVSTNIKKIININSIKNINYWNLFFIIKYFEDRNILQKSWANIENELSLGIDIFISYHKKEPCHYIDDNYFNQILVEYINKIDLTENPYVFLLNQLKEFEYSFSDYINKICEEHDYTKTALSKLKTLYDDINQHEIFENDALVLNFNYTNPFNGLHHINIHGNAYSNNIIFGIDDFYLHSENTLNIEKSIFTKTYRQLVLNNKTEEILFDNDIQYIVFYGHSLSKSDYSYFHSLFDYYDIYNSHYKQNSSIKLIFVYSYYEKYDKDKGNITLETKNEITREYTKAVYQLIHEYGNKNQRINLLHKLILENRIKILNML